MSAPVADEKLNGISLLQRFARRRMATEQCEMCGAQLAPEHPHLIEPSERKLRCACDACAMLFTAQPGTKLRRVPRRALYLRNFQMSDAQWSSLMIPIELVFLFHSSPQQRIAAFYPSPAGATESLLPLELWSEIARENPALEQMTPDVEALLVNRVGIERGVEPSYYIAPIDECYKLVGVIRRHWHGLSGGPQMWGEIAAYFTQLRQKSSPVGDARNV